MHSSSGSAASRRAGVGHADDRVAGDGEEHLDLPLARRARSPRRGTRPAPGPAPRARRDTRDVQLPKPRGPSLAVDAIHAIGHATGLPHMSPPGRSNLPTTMFTTSTSHDASVPNSWLHSPMRPYTAPVGAAANSRARRRIVSAGTRQNASTDSGVNSAHTLAHGVDALDLLLERAERREPLGEEHVAHREQERGVGPGRIGTHSSAWSAVPVRRGSTTTTRPPRARMPSSSPRTSGHASSEPPDACGLPPMQIR